MFLKKEIDLNIRGKKDSISETIKHISPNVKKPGTKINLIKTNTDTRDENWVEETI